uniref:Uncharacterized protein n=1 Tax=Anguilla anguilla TaxID=7936 RepID=A0A0E9XGT3_ANGAN
MVFHPKRFGLFKTKIFFFFFFYCVAQSIMLLSECKLKTVQ